MPNEFIEKFKEIWKLLTEIREMKRKLNIEERNAHEGINFMICQLSVFLQAEEVFIAEAMDEE